jgi:hypothetical protein
MEDLAMNPWTTEDEAHAEALAEIAEEEQASHAWAETCAECLRTDVDMARDRMCADCDAEIQRAARKERRRIEEEGRGDWERDQRR